MTKKKLVAKTMKKMLITVKMRAKITSRATNARAKTEHAVRLKHVTLGDEP